jgi:hypothetical protein
MDRKRSASEKAIDPTTQMKVGEAIRSQYDLGRPLPDKLDALVTRLDDRDRQTNGSFHRPIAASPAKYHPLGAASMDKKDGHIVETAVEARGGLLGRPVLTVLVISTVLLVAAFALIYYGFFG